MQRISSQRSERHSAQTVLGQHALELERHSDVRRLAHRRQEADALHAQTPKRESDRPRRRRVEPLHVVDGHKHRPTLSQDAQDVEEGNADRPSIGDIVAGLGEQQRDFERAPPHRQQQRRHVRDHIRQKVRQTRERQGGLGLDPPAGQNTLETPLGLGDALLPQDRLADARLTRKDQRHRTALDRRKERPDRTERLVSPDDGRHGHTLATILTWPEPERQA